ncbi:uncharacterized protein BXIN_1141 [Babesia sp. Xinjiang]|uniref:uncharacterized protein n=1 Tax=Babesia sp. Xinjiang TaxID=462227 RepID=UPI000A26657B|nr:uncharacterized protein BXIN_1141 [Babesia sp. Xinjiang]ORM42360.1 hypothetical protein BXIN_1141 [Babesia sp. Xinjiang]
MHCSSSMPVLQRLRKCFLLLCLCLTVRREFVCVVNAVDVTKFADTAVTLMNEKRKAIVEQVIRLQALIHHCVSHHKSLLNHCKHYEEYDGEDSEKLMLKGECHRLNTYFGENTRDLDAYVQLGDVPREYLQLCEQTDLKPDEKEVMLSKKWRSMWKKQTLPSKAVIERLIGKLVVYVEDSHHLLLKILHADFRHSKGEGETMNTKISTAADAMDAMRTSNGYHVSRDALEPPSSDPTEIPEMNVPVDAAEATADDGCELEEKDKVVPGMIEPSTVVPESPASEDMAEDVEPSTVVPESPASEDMAEDVEPLLVDDRLTIAEDAAGQQTGALATSDATPTGSISTGDSSPQKRDIDAFDNYKQTLLKLYNVHYSVKQIMDIVLKVVLEDSKNGSAASDSKALLRNEKAAELMKRVDDLYSKYTIYDSMYKLYNDYNYYMSKLQSAETEFDQHRYLSELEDIRRIFEIQDLHDDLSKLGSFHKMCNDVFAECQELEGELEEGEVQYCKMEDKATQMATMGAILPTVPSNGLPRDVASGGSTPEADAAGPDAKKIRHPVPRTRRRSGFSTLNLVAVNIITFLQLFALV